MVIPMEKTNIIVPIAHKHFYGHARDLARPSAFHAVYAVPATQQPNQTQCTVLFLFAFCIVTGVLFNVPSAQWPSP